MKTYVREDRKFQVEGFKFIKRFPLSASHLYVVYDDGERVILKSQDGITEFNGTKRLLAACIERGFFKEPPESLGLVAGISSMVTHRQDSDGHG